MNNGTKSTRFVDADEPGLALLAASLLPTIEERPVPTLIHYRHRWVWPPTFRSTWGWEPFVQDIRLYGIREPLIILSDGQVVDGGHRLEAARALGLAVAPVRVLNLPLPLSDLDQFALEHWAVYDTLARRQLRKHEISRLLVGLEEAIVAVEKTLKKKLPRSGSVRVEDLSEAFGMSPAHIKRILALAHRGSEELRERVKRGDLSIDRAYRLLQGKIQSVSQHDDDRTLPAWQRELDALVGEGEALIAVALSTAEEARPKEREAIREAIIGSLQRVVDAIETQVLIVGGWSHD